MPKKPIFVLQGRIVTMLSQQDIIEDGFLAIEDCMITGIAKTLQELPDGFSQAPVISTGGTIYPGLIDLHNHFAYNFFPLWVVPSRFDNRGQWRNLDEYKSLVQAPAAKLAKFSVTAKAMMRYVEAKAIIGGTTTGQGIGTKVTGVTKIYDGAMRNVEIPGDARLKACGTNVNDMKNEPTEIERFRKMLNDENIGFFFHHLSEGVDDDSHQHFLNLKDNRLINNKLVGIHSLGLNRDDLDYMFKQNAKIVWSPLSNTILYGKTLNLHDLKESGVLFCLGCDWTPSGSKNLLEELKVAKFYSVEQCNIFSDYELAAMVTSDAAKVTGWQDYLGTLGNGKIADLLVLNGTTKNPYLQLIEATEKDIDLVVIDGIARYGTQINMKALHFDLNNRFEKTNIAERPMGIYMYSESSEINNIGFADAVNTLKEAMQDLPNFVAKMESHAYKSLALVGEIFQDFQIIMDMDAHEHQQDNAGDEEKNYELWNDIDPLLLPESIEFDDPTAFGDLYWSRFNNQPNLSPALKQWIGSFYQ